MKKRINLVVEHLFQRALKKSLLALLIINTTKYLYPTFYGIWLYRKGDISGSLSTLSQVRTKNFIAQRSIRRSEDLIKRIYEARHTLEDSPTLKKPRITFNGHVLFAVHSNGFYHPNGYAVRTHNIINSLTSIGIKVSCVNRLGYPWDLIETSDSPIVETKQYLGVDFYQTYDKNNLISDCETTYIESYADILVKQAEIQGASVIHAHSSYLNGLSAARAANKLQIKSCYEVRGLWHLSRAIKEPLFENSEHYHYCQQMELLACKKVDFVFTLTNALKNWLVANGIQESKIAIVPNAVNKQQKKHSLAHSQKTELVLGFIGSVTEYEGLDLVLRAIAKVQSMNKQAKIRMIIAGNGSFLPSLKKLANKLKIEKSVEFLGRVDKTKVPALYQKIDLVTVARKRSLLTELVSPLKHLEAFSFGVPCLVTNLESICETARHNDNSIIVEPDDECAIANVLIKALNDKNYLPNLAANIEASSDLIDNWDSVAQTYLDNYRTL